MSLVHSTQDTDPVYTKGNWFWKDNERFLIKGISYIPRRIGGDSYGAESKLDPFDDARLDELERDIPVLQELGVNTIQVSALKPDKSYAKAMYLLMDAGIHVLVTFFEDVESEQFESHITGSDDDVSKLYTAEIMKPALKIVDEMANYPNLLGFVVGVDHVWTKLAELCAAAVRDIKAFLRQRGGRCPPVGVSINDIAMTRVPMLKYFTAGEQKQRIDFFAMDCFNWAHKSSFQISGWKNMVEMLGKYPVPMYFSAFGANVGARLWEEIGCLYSPDMTGVFSGGCVYTFLEYGNRYGIIDVRNGEIERKGFKRLKSWFHKVNIRDEDEMFTAECKDYEGWMGEFPVADDRWRATPNLPMLEGGLHSLMQQMQDENGDDADRAVPRVTEQVKAMTIEDNNHSEA